MSSTIFMVGPDNSLTEMHSSEFASEADFQTLLADHPALLRLAAGTDGDLLLVSQEVGVADQQGGADRWNIDHLFLTKSGVPVLVEVKRATDNRARREVVAQMLDYASHGTAYWSAEDIANRFQQTAAAQGHDPEVRLQEFLGDEDPEGFWRQVEANLRAGRVRMAFVADKIAKELRRIVEFLNEQMRPAEVLAIEVAQFTNANGVRTLVPQLVGATERAQSAKSVTPHLDPISLSDWIAGFQDLHGEEVGQLATKAAAFLEGQGLRPRLVPTQRSVAFELADPEGKSRAVVYILRKGGLQIGIETLKHFPAYADEVSRTAVLEDLRRLLPELRTSSSGANSWPTVPLSMLQKDDAWARLSRLLAEIVVKIRASDRLSAGPRA